MSKHFLTYLVHAKTMKFLCVHADDVPRAVGLIIPEIKYTRARVILYPHIP